MMNMVNQRNRHARRSIVLSLVLVVGLLAACGTDTGNVQSAKQEAAVPSNSTEVVKNATEKVNIYPLTIKDELGHELKIPSKPTKIFAPIMEDSLVTLGIKPTMQWSNGVNPQVYLQDQLGSVPQISFAGGLPSFEAVLDSQPELIILHNSYASESGAYEKYAKIAPTYVFKNATTDLNSSLRALGKLLDESDKAEQAIKSYADKAANARTKLEGKIKGKKAAIIRFNAKGMFFMNSNYFSGYVLKHDLGFEQSDLVKDGALEVSLEILPELDADYIFLINDGNQGDRYFNELRESEVWKNVPAVKNGHVFETSNDYWLSGGFIANGKVIDDVARFLQP
ncbi:ferrichrome ABC transporter substrate-binding protein [Brevibacillus reuszeri]|uniref:Ferrichrome ABC transporter substrate-binding protein n=1 Tax=Brevibacillus reuszeri TaxID=54915 RepID=A0A0K9Z0G1_9BACL|nr:ABC transporter substrate-binding protein [Brevibacillus reuszeri]KNB74401.1 ferrichrome ABC transporter substrate-binding protein [Brevibacillus reuszeri]MED1856313.1 ABC transporter substrate-binding protein [Brevibacillus reuszeri]GED67992.1 ferrichrome ABC transporter substrate-binding protein [Brevibacillus reuszeri]